MSTKIFVNLPVKELKRSVAFFTELGFTFNPQFTDDSATCMIVSEEIYFMLLEEDRFQTFTPKPVANAFNSTEVLLALSLDSKDAVVEKAEKALNAGATLSMPAQDHGFMYAQSIQDLDGHIWEFFWMDPNYVVPQQ